MKKYFGDKNPRIPRNVFLQLASLFLTPRDRIQFRTVCKIWNNALSESVYKTTGADSLDDFKERLSKLPNPFPARTGLKNPIHSLLMDGCITLGEAEQIANLPKEEQWSLETFKCLNTERGKILLREELITVEDV